MSYIKWAEEQDQILLNIFKKYRTDSGIINWSLAEKEKAFDGLPDILPKALGKRLFYLRNRKNNKAYLQRQKTYYRAHRNEINERRRIQKINSVDYTLEQVRGLVRDMGKSSPKDFKTAVIILSGIFHSYEIEKLENFTGYPRTFISPIIENLSKNGVIDNGKYITEFSIREMQQNPTKFIVQLWIHVLAAQGMIKRVFT